MRKIIPIIFSAFLSVSLMGQANGGWGNCEFTTVVAMNAFDPSSSNFACKKAFVQATEEHYYWDGSAWVIVSDDQNASEVPFTPAGTISATDVQAAIEEIEPDIYGSIDVHSDVDVTTTAPTSGDLLAWDGTNFVPQSTDNGYTIFNIWAEEAADLSLTAASEWAFGNGDNTPVGHGVVIPVDCELFAMSLDHENGVNTIVRIVKNSDSSLSTYQASNSGVEQGYNTFGTPLSFSAGDVVNFRTISSSVGGNSGRVSAWFRIRATAASTSIVNDMLDVSAGAIANGDILQYNGSSFVPLTLNAANIPYDNSTSGLTATTTQAAIDEIVSGGVGTDDQALSLSTNTLILEDGGSVDLSNFAENIYNTSDALTANRVVDLNSNSLTFDGTGTGDVIIEADGDIGIGTLSPTQKLDVAGANKVQIGTFGGSGGGKLRVDVSDGEAEVQGIKSNLLRTTGTNYAINGTAAGSGATTNIGLYGWASDATNNRGLWVESGFGIFDNKVGIGTRTPGAQLEVTYDRDQAFTIAEPDDGTNTFLSSIVAINENSGNWSRALTALTPNIADGSVSGLLTFGQGDATRQAGHMYFVDRGADGDEYVGFGVRNGAWNILNMTGSGNVGIGTFTPDAKLDVEGGTVRFSDYGGGTNTGTLAQYLAVTTDGDIIEVGSSSGNNGVATISTTSHNFNGTRQDNWAPTGLAASPPFEVYRVNATSNTDLTGISSTGMVDGQKITLLNIGTNRIRIRNQNGNSSATNRIITPGGGNKDINDGYAITFIYDATSSRWRTYSTAE